MFSLLFIRLKEQRPISSNALTNLREIVPEAIPTKPVMTGHQKCGRVTKSRTKERERKMGEIRRE